MASTVLNIKIDTETKVEAQQTAKELGMPLSVIIKAFLRQLNRTKSITFSLDDETPNEHLQTILKQADENLETGQHSPVFKSANEAIDWLEDQGV